MNIPIGIISDFGTGRSAGWSAWYCNWSFTSNARDIAPWDRCETHIGKIREVYLVRKITCDERFHIHSRQEFCVVCLYILQGYTCGESEVDSDYLFVGSTRNLDQLLFRGPMQSIDEVLGIVTCTIDRLLQGRIPVIAGCLRWFLCQLGTCHRDRTREPSP